MKKSIFVLLVVLLGAAGCTGFDDRAYYYDYYGDYDSYDSAPFYGRIIYIPIYCPCPIDCEHHHEYGVLYADHFDSDGRHVNSRGISRKRIRSHPRPDPRREITNPPGPVAGIPDLPRTPDVPIESVEITPMPPRMALPRPRVPIVEVTLKEDPLPDESPPREPKRKLRPRPRKSGPEVHPKKEIKPHPKPAPRKMKPEQARDKKNSESPKAREGGRNVPEIAPEKAERPKRGKAGRTTSKRRPKPQRAPGRLSAF